MWVLAQFLLTRERNPKYSKCPPRRCGCLMEGLIHPRERERERERFLTKDKGPNGFAQKSFCFHTIPAPETMLIQGVTVRIIDNSKNALVNHSSSWRGRRSGQYVEQQTTDWYMPTIGISGGTQRTWIDVRRFFTLYHAKSPLNQHLGNVCVCVSFFSNHLIKRTKKCVLPKGCLLCSLLLINNARYLA